MPTFYDGNSIIPGPLVQIEKEVTRSAAGTKQRPTYVLTVRGTLLPTKGSPSSSGTFWTTTGYPPDETIAADGMFASLRSKQGALCALFCQEGKWLEFVPWDGSPALKCQPRLRNSVFQEGVWFNRCDYTFTFEADTVWFGAQECCADGDGGADPVEESWELEQADDAARTYRLTHAVGAQYRDRYASGGTVSSYGWELAKTAVEARLGFQQSKLTQSGVLNLGAFRAFNHARAVSEDRSGGAYRVNESWLCFDASGAGAAAVEDYTVTTRTQGGRSAVSVEGSIQGLMERDANFAVSTSKYANAVTKWGAVQNLVLTRAQDASGLTLNPAALSQQVARNELTGLINYGFEYDDRYTFGGATTFDVTVQDQNSADVFAVIPVVGRPAGPVLQDIGSSTETSRTVSVNATYPAWTYASGVAASGLPPIGLKPDVSSYILAYQPVASQLFVARDEDQWNVTSNTYSRTVTWVYQ